jgi:hypothetical protein
VSSAVRIKIGGIPGVFSGGGGLPCDGLGPCARGGITGHGRSPERAKEWVSKSRVGWGQERKPGGAETLEQQAQGARSQEASILWKGLGVKARVGASVGGIN